jgi:hypothetical protein
MIYLKQWGPLKISTSNGMFWLNMFKTLDVTKKVNLYAKLYGMEMQEGTSIIDCIKEIKEIKTSIIVGEMFIKEWLVHIVLNALPPSY